MVVTALAGTLVHMQRKAIRPPGSGSAEQVGENGVLAALHFGQNRAPVRRWRFKRSCVGGHSRCRNHLALAHQLRARIAAAEGDAAEAESQLSRAAATLGDALPPLVAWRVYRTAAEFYAGVGRDAEAAACQDRLAATLRTLAAHFDAEEPMRASLLGAATAACPAAPGPPLAE